MAVEIRVPALGESVVEATIARWLKQEGESVQAGEPLVELETDKVNVEVPAEESGVLGAIARQVGDTVGVGEVLGTLGASGNGAAAAAVAPPVAAATAAPAAAPANDHAPAATPVAQKIAQENNIDLAQVKGTGPGGRITKENVADLVEQKASAPASAVKQAAQTQQHVAQAEAAQAAGAPPVAAPPSSNTAAEPLLPAAFGDDRQVERVRMTTRRRTIAKRLVEAQHTAAMLTTFNEVDMSAVMALRTKRKDQFKERFGVNLGFMSFFTKAVIGALKGFPNLNAEITPAGDEILVKRFYDIGIAVGVAEGLVVPVVRDADKKSFAEIEKTIGDLAARAKDNKLKLDELQGGTFTITNGGVFGSLLSTPILNAPQVGILGMHTIQERPVARDGQVLIRPMMYVALSYDHRIVDGGEAVRFLVRVKQLIEDPESLLLEG